MDRLRYLYLIPIPVCLFFLLTVVCTEPAHSLGVNDYGAGATANGIAGSRHNLGAYGPVMHTVNPNGIGYIPPNTLGTTEICVFCHTPHHGKGNAPLWNRVNATTYTAYGTTVAGTKINDADIGGATLACLSCHDGVTQFDVLVNGPGKGNNGTDSTSAADMGWWFMMPGEFYSIYYPLDHFDTSPGSPCTGCHGLYNPSDRLSLGVDLTNDHPVSVVYNENVASLRPINTVIASIDLTSGLASSASADTNLSQNRWAIKGFIDGGTATIKDLLRNNRVECVSCHDPHFKNLSWDEVERTWSARYCSGESCSDGNFLRRVGGNTGSAVCRTCHNK